jgi:hypothetical protein
MRGHRRHPDQTVHRAILYSLIMQARVWRGGAGTVTPMRASLHSPLPAASLAGDCSQPRRRRSDEDEVDELCFSASSTRARTRTHTHTHAPPLPLPSAGDCSQPRSRRGRRQRPRRPLLVLRAAAQPVDLKLAGSGGAGDGRRGRREGRSRRAVGRRPTSPWRPRACTRRARTAAAAAAAAAAVAATTAAQTRVPPAAQTKVPATWGGAGGANVDLLKYVSPNRLRPPLEASALIHDHIQPRMQELRGPGAAIGELRAQRHPVAIRACSRMEARRCSPRRRQTIVMD